MPVDRLSVTVPSELGDAVRALAELRNATVSAVVTEAIAREVRLAALDDALAMAEAKFGPVSEERIAEAEAALARASRGATRPRRGR